MTTIIKGDFPFDEIRDTDGNLFPSLAKAREAGFNDDQIWSVVEGDSEEEMDPNDPDYEPSSTWVYGPSHHYVNVLGYVATNERHDGDTYYEKEF